MNAGTTYPFLVSCDDSKQYVMKCINDVTNGKALFNEIVASRLMKILRIPSPNAEIAKISQAVIDTNDLLLVNNTKAGKCFISEFVKGGSLGVNPITVKMFSNEYVFPEIIFFDALIMNIDRGLNKGNWYMDKYNKELLAIDHTDIFHTAKLWDSISLQQDTKNPPEIIDALDDESYILLTDEFKRRHPDSRHPFSPMKRKLDCLTPESIESCFKDIPDEWEISSEDLAAARKFIFYQIEHASDILSQLENKFNFNKGGFLRG